jgi:DNA-directed RNA polymerase specialized sigma24 family protein
MSVTEEVLNDTNPLDTLLFHMKIENGLSEAEVAELLGITRQNVTSRLRKVYKRIRERC